MDVRQPCQFCPFVSPALVSYYLSNLIRDCLGVCAKGNLWGNLEIQLLDTLWWSTISQDLDKFGPRSQKKLNLLGYDFVVVPMFLKWVSWLFKRTTRIWIFFQEALVPRNSGKTFRVFERRDVSRFSTLVQISSFPEYFISSIPFRTIRPQEETLRFYKTLFWIILKMCRTSLVAFRPMSLRWLFLSSILGN